MPGKEVNTMLNNVMFIEDAPHESMLFMSLADFMEQHDDRDPVGDLGFAPDDWIEIEDAEDKVVEMPDVDGLVWLNDGEIDFQIRLEDLDWKDQVWLCSLEESDPKPKQHTFKDDQWPQMCRDWISELSVQTSIDKMDRILDKAESYGLALNMVYEAYQKRLEHLQWRENYNADVRKKLLMQALLNKKNHRMTEVDQYVVEREAAHRRLFA
jgi:hypothetical protein